MRPPNTATTFVSVCTPSSSSQAPFATCFIMTVSISPDLCHAQGTNEIRGRSRYVTLHSRHRNYIHPRTQHRPAWPTRRFIDSEGSEKFVFFYHHSWRYCLLYTVHYDNIFMPTAFFTFSTFITSQYPLEQHSWHVFFPLTLHDDVYFEKSTALYCVVPT